MPLYDYECTECGETFEEIFKLDEYKYRKFIPCKICSGMAERKVGAHIQRDEPTWLESACENLLPEGKDVKPIESRCEFNKYLREHKIAQVG